MKATQERSERQLPSCPHCHRPAITRCTSTGWCWECTFPLVSQAADARSALYFSPYDPYELAEWEFEHDRMYGDQPTSWSDAHAEWHRNAGVPMGQPGCPWDACDLPYEPDPDFIVENHGSLCLLDARTDAARAWVSEHIDPDAQTWCGRTVVEPRYVDEIIAGANADGFYVEVK